MQNPGTARPGSRAGAAGGGVGKFCSLNPFAAAISVMLYVGTSLRTRGLAHTPVVTISYRLTSGYTRRITLNVSFPTAVLGTAVFHCLAAFTAHCADDECYLSCKLPSVLSMMSLTCHPQQRD